MPKELTELKKKCPECRGLGYIYTGGCSLEHGISTTCEDYGCLPRVKKACSVCNGKKFVVISKTADLSLKQD